MRSGVCLPVSVLMSVVLCACGPLDRGPASSTQTPETVLDEDVPVDVPVGDDAADPPVDDETDPPAQGCTSCHGEGDQVAPPLDCTGGRSPTHPGVGAHAAHLRVSTLFRTVACDECHVVPTSVAAPEHLGEAPAELVWGPLANAHDVESNYADGRCTTYCHGATLEGGTATNPIWTVVDRSQGRCNSCHGFPPPSPHPLIPAASCGPCHPFTATVPRDPAAHVNGIVDLNLGEGPCGACHASPPADPGHLRHAGATTPVYGGTGREASSDASTSYGFGCGVCHPSDLARHVDGVSDVPVTCNNTYCHSSGTAVATGVVEDNAAPAWGSDALACDGCHGAPPDYFQDEPKSNSHSYHRFSCDHCHDGTTHDGLSVADALLHTNGTYDVAPGPHTWRGVPLGFTYTFDPGGGTCTNISCHAGIGRGTEIRWGRIYLNAILHATYVPGCFEVAYSVTNEVGGTAPYSYVWDFGDGATADGRAVTHAYADGTERTVRLELRDAKNHVGYLSTSVVPQPLANTPPIAASQVSAFGFNVTFTDLSTDADANACTHSGDGLVRVRWGYSIPNCDEWDCSGNITMESSAALALGTSPTGAVFSHSYPQSTNSRTYGLRHLVTDNSGALVSPPDVSLTLPTKRNLTLTGRIVDAAGSGVADIAVHLVSQPSGFLDTWVTSGADGTYAHSAELADLCYYATPLSGSYGFAPTSVQGCSAPASTTISFGDSLATPL